MSVFVEEYASWDDDDAVDAVPLGICPACTKEVELDPNPQAPPQWICSECGAAVQTLLSRKTPSRPRP